ncbi:hypothetical protein KFE98_12915 [bacterium SCSIO 12741]|nr:hypothetical protein KFE98_12915 [bacterium SCSIO 12741]
MNDENFPENESDDFKLPQPQEVDIPADFHSYSEEGPFHQCQVCEKELLHSNEDYFIEKAMKRVNSTTEYVVYEYALCTSCAETLQEKMSEESRLAIKRYMWMQANPMMLQQRMEGNGDWKEKAGSCLIKGTPKEEVGEYTLCGYFRGNKLLVREFPYMISFEAMDEISELLSEETKDEMDDFKNTYLGGPPELEELFKGKPLLVL